MAVITITPANVIPSAQANILRNYTYGATVTAGQLVYVSASVLQWALVDLDAQLGTKITDIVGLALNNGSINQPAAVAITDPDLTLGGTLTNGLAVYGSITPGGVSQADIPTTGAYPVLLGIAKSTTKMNFKPTASGNII